MPRATQLCRATLPDGSYCLEPTGAPGRGYCERHADQRRAAQAAGRKAAWERGKPAGIGRPRKK